MSEEALNDVGSDVSDFAQSFWAIGNYRKVVKRVDEGAKLCFDFVKMVHERADIEAKYSKRLDQWSKKWEESINKGPEYGTLQNGWKAILHEANRQSELHNEINRKLNSLASTITDWRTSNYHKSISGHYKETKQTEEGFGKAQKPWEKIFLHCNKAKKSYHQTSQELETINNTLITTEKTSNDMTIENLQKLHDKKEKTEKECERNEEKYKSKIMELFHDKSRYVEAMKQEFEKCQAFERKRMDFFRMQLLKMKDIIDLSHDERVTCIYQVCSHVLSQINADNDLEWYSLHYGPDMHYTWPVYEEYKAQSQLQNITSGESRSSMDSISHSSEAKSSESIHNMLERSQSSLNRLQSKFMEQEQVEQIQDDSIDASLQRVSHIYESIDKNDEETSPNLKTMRALYPYTGEDEDDLSFNEGDIVHVVELCNGGWAKAFLGQHYGYIPVEFFEEIS